MEVKNKPVTLEDLKELKEWMEGVAEVYKDITDTLTWNDATWVPQIKNDVPYKDSSVKDPTHQGQGDLVVSAAYENVKVAKIQVSPGERYKVTGWHKNERYCSVYMLNESYTQETYSFFNFYMLPLATADASDNLITTKLGDLSRANYAPVSTSNAINTMGTKTTKWVFLETDIKISQNAKYLYVFDYSYYFNGASGDIIVEKAQ